MEPGDVVRRVGLWVVLLGSVGSAVLFFWKGATSAMSFALGSCIAYVGFQVQVRLVDRALSAGSELKGVGRKVFWRLLSPVVLIFALMRLDMLVGVAVLWGMLTPAAAVMVESVGYIFAVVGRK